MNRELQERLRQQTAAARQRHHDSVGQEIERQETESRALASRSELAAAGTLFVLPENAEQPVEWAVLEITSLKSRRVAPVDDQPLVGSTDIEVQAPTPGEPYRGPAVLRCAFAREVDRRLLTRGRRSGQLPPESIDAALALHRKLQAGEPAGTAIGREVETEPEYRRWLEDVVTPACQAVDSVAAADNTPEPELETPERPPRHSPRRAWAVAASLLLLSSLALTWNVLKLREERADALDRLADVQKPLGELQAEQERLNRELDEAMSDRDRLRLALEEKSAVSGLRTLANIPLAVLATGVRGEPEVVTVPESAPFIGLVIEMNTAKSHHRYALEVSDWQDSPIMTQEELVPARGLISIFLPAKMLPPAAYRLRLRRVSPDAQSQTLTLIVERP